MLKRGRIGLLPGGVDSAMPGSCAIECPACPRPVQPSTRTGSDDDGPPPRTDSNSGHRLEVNELGQPTHLEPAASIAVPPPPSPDRVEAPDASGDSRISITETSAKPEPDDDALPTELKQE